MIKNKIILITILILFTQNVFSYGLTPYEKYKAGIKKVEYVEVPPEIQEYRDYELQVMDKRIKGIGKPFQNEKSRKKIQSIKECVNSKTTKEEIRGCIPSILRGNY
jgi:hypothetical protein